MTMLKALQESFLDSILLQDSRFLSEISDHPRLSHSDQAEIYTDAYHLRLIEVLQDSYPALHTLVGDELFERIALDYINRYPSQHFSVRHFGHSLDNFIEHHNAYEHAELLTEMARFEWALRNAFDEVDQASLSIDSLQHIGADDWGSIKFEIGRHVCLLRLDWNVPALWKAIEQDAEPQAPQRNPTTIDWLIWRPELETRFRSLSTQEANLIRKLSAGESFAQLCESLLTDGCDEPANIAAGHLQQWLADGLITTYTLNKK